MKSEWCCLKFHERREETWNEKGTNWFGIKKVLVSFFVCFIFFRWKWMEMEEFVDDVRGLFLLNIESLRRLGWEKSFYFVAWISIKVVSIDTRLRLNLKPRPIPNDSLFSFFSFFKSSNRNQMRLPERIFFEAWNLPRVFFYSFFHPKQKRTKH